MTVTHKHRTQGAGLASYRGLAARDTRPAIAKAADDLAARAFRHAPRQRHGRNSTATASAAWGKATRGEAYTLRVASSSGLPAAIDKTATWQSSDAVATRLPAHQPTQTPQFKDCHIQQTHLPMQRHCKISNGAMHRHRSDGAVEGRDQGGQQFGGRCQHGHPTSGAAPG